jgi:DNA transformation protein
MYDWSKAPPFDPVTSGPLMRALRTELAHTGRLENALMAVQAQYLDYVLEQLAGLERVNTRRMFGGVGLYSGELFFGLIDDDTLFFKTDESNAAQYQSRRMPRFMPPANRPMGPMGYHQVPADIIEDGETLVAWARQSVRWRWRRARSRPRDRARSASSARRVPERCGSGRRAIRPAASRSSRDTHRREWPRRLLSAMGGVQSFEIAGDREHQSVRRIQLPDSRCQMFSTPRSRHDDDFGWVRYSSSALEQAHVPVREAVDSPATLRAACFPRLRGNGFRPAGNLARIKTRGGDAIARGDGVVAEALAAMDQGSRDRRT